MELAEARAFLSSRYEFRSARERRLRRACDDLTVIERRIVTSTNSALADLIWPVFEARGERDGPRLTLMAGIHGG